MEGVSFRHVVRIGPVDTRAALAGATAALVWAAQEPLDRRVFRLRLLRRRAARQGCEPEALADRRPPLHAANGALFGLAWRRRGSPVALALAENAALWPLTALVDRYHPARGEAGLPPLHGNRAAFAQACWRHALFGWVLGRLAR